MANDNSLTFDAARLAELRRWFEVSWSTISDYILESFSILDLDSVQHRLLAELPTCPSRCPAQFRQWCREQVSSYASDQTLFDLARVRTVQDVLELAACRPFDPATKPLKYEQHGETVFIDLQDADGRSLIWKIPASWLPVARALWPVYVRRMPNKRPYASKKTRRQRHNGTWSQIDTPVHHLFLNAPKGATVDALNGDYLDYTADNLRVHELAESTRLAKEVPLTEWRQKSLTNESLSAKSTRLPANRESTVLNAHERKVAAWLGVPRSGE
jgi:hypothetical protein